MNPHQSILTAVILTLAACGSLKPTAPEKTKPEDKKEVIIGPKLVGQITSYHAEQHFVLIQYYGKWEVVNGAILTTRGPDARSANLRVTGEKLGEFAAADLQSGTVEKGDAVYSQHIPQPIAPPPAAIPLPPQKEPSAEELPKNN
jgi:hypothetical protein